LKLIIIIVRTMDAQGGQTQVSGPLLEGGCLELAEGWEPGEMGGAAHGSGAK